MEKKELRKYFMVIFRTFFIQENISKLFRLFSSLKNFGSVICDIFFADNFQTLVFFTSDPLSNSKAAFIIKERSFFVWVYSKFASERVCEKILRLKIFQSAGGLRKLLIIEKANVLKHPKYN